VLCVGRPYRGGRAYVRDDLPVARRDAGCAHADELQALHAEVYADPPYRQQDDAALFAGRFRVQRRQPDFALAEVRHGDYLVGFASGMPLRPSTSWWRELTAPLPAEVTAEHSGRTFAVTDLLVRASWRRQASAGPCMTCFWRTGPRTGHAHRAARGGPAQPPWPGGLAEGSPRPRVRPRLVPCPTC